MKLQLIRNATMKITYGGKTILTDPMLSPKDAIRSFAGIAKNPTVDLPLSIDDIVLGIDGVIVTHTHPDHYDDAAAEALSRDLPVFCQPMDIKMFQEQGYFNIISVDTTHEWEGIRLIRTGGKHGKGDILERMGDVSGFVLKSDGEPTVYWVGDSIFCGDVEKAVLKYQPDIIITHSGGATIPGFDPIIMTAEDTLVTAKSAPRAVIIAIHMEALDHCTVSREVLRLTAEAAGISTSRLIIPNDGETIEI